MSDATYFDDPQLDRLASLLLELAGQLHVARHRVGALELLLTREGLLEADAVDSFEPSGSELDVLQEVGDRGMRGLFRILTEHGPVEHPLREEAARVEST